MVVHRLFGRVRERLARVGGAGTADARAGRAVQVPRQLARTRHAGVAERAELETRGDDGGDGARAGISAPVFFSFLFKLAPSVNAEDRDRL